MSKRATQCARTGALTIVGALAICGVFAGPALAVPTGGTPSISGTPQVGQLLTLTPGVWTGGGPVTLTEQWMSCDSSNTCTGVGTGANTYTVQSSDDTNTIEVVETATDTSDSSTNTATTNALGPVTYPAPTGGTPSISGGTNPPRQGQTLTASPGSWSPDNPPTLVFNYQWQRCDSGGIICSTVGGNQDTYVLGAGDIGKIIQVAVRTSDDGGPGGPATSPATAVVIPLAPVSHPPGPTISGSPLQGQTLTAAPGPWANSPTFTYQWQQCDSGGSNCSAVGANQNTYALTFADAGLSIRVRVLALNAGGFQVAYSNLSGPVIPLPPVIQSAPLILGSIAQGQTLSLVRGSWTNGPTGFSDQWERCDSTGTACVAIAGSTGMNYIVGGADVGHELRVIETASNVGGPSQAASSPPTSPVAVQASFTSLLSVPTSLVTNQDVTLIATITSSAGVAFPDGTVTFDDRGVAIGGCVKEPVQPTDQSITVTCQTSFAASTSPEQLTAVFTPRAGASVGGSTGPATKPYTIVVAKDSTSTDLQVSNPTVNVGGSATYTATVTPANTGSAHPTGSVAFLDGGKPISGCGARTLTSAQGFLSATCKVGYKKSGTHSITARYGGDTSFSGSGTPSSQSVNVHAQPAHCCVTATMLWTFHFAPTYTQILTFDFAQVPVGGSVLVACHGRGCPFARTSVTVKKAKACRRTAKHRCPPQHPASFNLAGRFRFRHLALGTKIIVQIVQPGWVGKYYGFTVRPRRAPSVRIACLAPGSSRAGAGC